MASNSIIDYMKNLGESVKFATTEHLKEQMPITANFIEQNKESFNAAYKTVTSMRELLPRLGRIEDNILYKKANQAFNNIRADLASGKFYHPEREDVMGQIGALSGLMSSMGGMGDDFMAELNAIFSGNFDDLDGAGEEGQDVEPTRPEMMVTKGDALVASALFKSQSTSTNCIGKLMTRLHENKNQMDRATFSMNVLQNQKQLSVTQAGFDLMTQGFNHIIAFNNDVLKTHVDNSQKFYTAASNTLNESNAILKSIHEMQSKVYKSEHSKQGGAMDDNPIGSGQPIDFNTIFKNGFNAQAYKQLLDSRYKKSPIAMVYALVSNLPMMMQQFIDNPLHHLAKSIVGGVIGDQINYQLQKLDKTISDSFSTGLLKLYNYGKENKDTMLGKVAQFFGFKQEEKTLSQIDVSKFERGSMSWNGEAQKTLTFVIPAHLSRIESALTGSERHFDMRTGKFVNASAAKNYEKTLKWDATKQSTEPINEFLTGMINNMNFDSTKEGQDARRQIQKYSRNLREAIYDYGGIDSGTSDYIRENFKKYGFEDELHADMMATILDAIPPEVKNSITRKVSEAKISKNKIIESDKSGSSIEYLLRGATDGMITDGKINRGSGLGTDNSNLPIWNTKLTELEDHRGNTVYDYLYMILQRLYQMGGIGGDTPTNPPPTTTTGNIVTPPNASNIILPNNAGANRIILPNGGNINVPANIDDILNSTREKRLSAIEEARKEQAKAKNQKTFTMKDLYEKVQQNAKDFHDASLNYRSMNYMQIPIEEILASDAIDDNQKAILKEAYEQLKNAEAANDNDPFSSSRINMKRKSGTSAKKKGTSKDTDKEQINMTNFKEMLKDDESRKTLSEQLIRMAKEQDKNYLDRETKASSSMFDIFGGAARNTEKYHKLPENINVEDSILSQLIAANDAGQVMDVVRHNIDALVDSPRIVMSSVIGKANEAVYDVLFGKNVGEVDSKGRPIKGIFQKMVSEVEKQSEGIGSGIKGFLKEVQKLFDSDNLLGFVGDFFKKETGIDVANLGKDLKKRASGVVRGIGSETMEALKSNGQTMKQYMHEAMNTVGLIDKKGKWNFGTTYANEKSDEAKRKRRAEEAVVIDEFSDEDSLISDNQTGVATGSDSFHGRGGIVSKGEMIVQPWKNPNYGKGTGIGSGVSVVKDTGYLDASQLPAGSMVLNNRDNLNPFATGASLTSDLKKEESVRSGMKKGITRRASIEEIPGYAEGKNNVARLQYLMDYSKNNTSNLTVTDLNRIIEAGLFKSKQEALLSTIIAEKDSRNEFGIDEKEKEQNKAKFSRDFREAQRLVIKLMNAGDKGRDLRAKGFVQDSNTGKIGVNDKAGVNFVKSMTTQEELGKRSYTNLAELRNYLESIGMGQFMPSDEEIGRRKFSSKQGPIVGIRQGILSATGTDPVKAVEMTKNFMLKEKKDIFSGATGGALLSMVLPLGGPLMGAVAGASFNLLRKSDTFNNYVFGTEIVKDGKKTGEREDNGLLSKKTQEILNKYVPDMKKFGTVGAIGGLITPFGPLGGAMLGAAASIVKNNASLHRMVFGKNGGLLNEKRKEAIKKAFPHVAMATISSILLGPFGLMGNAVLGASLGFLSTSEMFKKLVLGSKGRDGVRRGGLAGVIRRQVVEPLQDTMKDAKEHLGDWFKNKVFNPVAEGLKPLGRVMRGVIAQSSKALFDKVEEFLTSKRGFLPEFITKYTDKVFGGIRKAGGIGQWITQSLVGKATEKLANWTKKTGIGIENYAVSNGLVGGYSSKQLADVFQRTGEKSDRVAMINAMANLTDDEKLKLAESMQLLKSTRDDAQTYYKNQQDEEANLLKNDILKLAEGASGEEKNAIAQLNYEVNTDLFKKLMDIQNPEARKKFVDKFVNNTDIDKRNRKILSNKILKSLEVYAGYESDKQEAESGSYLDKPLKLVAEKLGLEDLTPEQIKKIMDENKIYDIAQNDKNSILDARELAKAEEEAKEKKEGEAVEVTPEVESTDKNTESLDNLTLAINQLTERLQFINGEIGVEDLKYSGNINSAENINARNLVNAARVSMTRDAVNEGMANAPDRVETAYEQFSRGEVLGAAGKVGRDAAAGVLNKYRAALTVPGDTANAFNKAVRDIYYGDKKLSIGGGLKGAASGAIAGGAADLALNSSIGGLTGAGAIINGAIKGSLQYTDKSSEFDKANGLADDINHIKYILQHKDEFSEEDVNNAKRLWHAIKQMKKNLKGRKESEYNTGDSLLDTVDKGRHMINKLPIIGKVQIGNTKPLYNNKIMKKIANASDDEIEALLKKAYRFSDEYGDEIKELVEKSKEKFKVEDKDDESDTPGAAAGTRFFVPGFAEGSSGLGSLFSSMKDAALKGGKESASEHLKKTKDSFKEHLSNINPFSSKSGSDSISGAVAKPAYPIVPPSMAESGAASADSNSHVDEQGRKVKEVTTSEGDVITYTESGQDGSWMRDSSKDNAKAEAKLEEKRNLARRTTNAIEAIAKRMGALKDSAKDTAKEGKGLFDDLLDFMKTPFKWLGGAISSAAGVLGGFLMTTILKPLKNGLVKLGKSVTKFVTTQVGKLGSFFTKLIGRTASGIASGILSMLKKNKVIATVLGIGGAITGKKLFDAFDTDEGYKDEVEGFNSKEAGLGAMTPKEQKIAAEMAKQGQSEEAIAKALRIRRTKMASEGLEDEVKGDKIQEKKDLFNTFSGLGGTLIGGAIGKMKGKGMLGSVIGGTLGSAVGDFVAEGETPTLGGLAWDAGMAYGTNKLLSFGWNKITGDYRSGRDASHDRTDRRERALERLRNIRRIREGRGEAPSPDVDTNRNGSSGSSNRPGLFSRAKTYLQNKGNAALDAARNLTREGGLLNKGLSFLKKNKKLAGIAALGGLAYNYFGGDDEKPRPKTEEEIINEIIAANAAANINQPDQFAQPGQPINGAPVAPVYVNRETGEQYTEEEASKLPEDVQDNLALVGSNALVAGGAILGLKKASSALGGATGEAISNNSNNSLKQRIMQKIVNNPKMAIAAGLSLPLAKEVIIDKESRDTREELTGEEQSFSPMGLVASTAGNIVGGKLGKLVGLGSIGSVIGGTAAGAAYTGDTDPTSVAQNLVISGGIEGASRGVGLIKDFVLNRNRLQNIQNNRSFGMIDNISNAEQALSSRFPSFGRFISNHTGALGTTIGNSLGIKLFSDKFNAMDASGQAATTAEAEGKIAVVMEKIKTGLESFRKGVSRFLPQGAAEGLEKFLGKIYEKISDPRTVRKAIPKLVKQIAGITAGAGIGGVLINAGFAAKAFYDGYKTDATAELFQIDKSKVTDNLKIISGLAHGLITFIPFIGPFLDVNWVRDICVDTVGKLIGITPEEIRNMKRSGSDDEEETGGIGGSFGEDESSADNITSDITDTQTPISTNTSITPINTPTNLHIQLSKQEMIENRAALKSKITDILNKIKSIITKYVEKNVVNAFDTLIDRVVFYSTGVEANYRNGIQKMMSKNKNSSISSAIMNFNPDDASISISYINGTSKAHDILEVPVGTASNGMKTIAGIISSIVSSMPFIHSFIQEKELKLIVVNTIGKASGISQQDILRLKDKYTQKSKKDTIESNNITQDKAKVSQGGASSTDKKVDTSSTTQFTNTKNSSDSSQKKDDGKPESTSKESKSTWQSVKETASSAWESAKSTASSAWESAKEAASSAWEGAKETGSAIYKRFVGTGKFNPAYGMGTKGSNSLFMQDDPRFGDNTKMENCLSFAMANLDRYKYGGNSTPIEFMKEAEKTGDKVPNDGTKPEFTAKALSKRGYDVSYVNKDQVKEKMKDPNTSIIAEGTDSRGINPKTPFAGKHYVAIDGMSKDGKKLSVMDSQTLDKSTSRDIYNSNELLNHTDKLIAITPKKSSSSVSKYAKSKYGMGRSTPNDTPEIWKYMKSKGLSNVAIAGILGNFQAESEMYSDRLEGHAIDKGSMDCPLDGHTGYGLAQWTYPTRQQALRNFAQSRGQQDGDWKTQIDFLLSGKDGDLTSIIKRMDDSGSAEKAAIIFHDEFEGSADDETRKQRRAVNAKKFFDTEGKGINDGSSSLSGGSSGSSGSSGGSSGSKPLGFFGALAKLISAFNPFTFDFDNPGQALSNAYNEFKSNVGGGGNSQVAGDSTSASKWADSSVGSTGFGRNGCTEFVKRYLQQAKSPLGDLMAKGEVQEDGHSLMWVPSLWKWAKKNNVFKEASQGGAQGDVALINTDTDPSDPDHVVIATGDGKYWGNSSSRNQIVKGDLAGDYGSSNIFGYVATGSGNGTVSTGEATRSKEEIVGDAGPTSGAGKFGKGKFGKGGFNVIETAKELIKEYGLEGALDNTTDPEVKEAILNIVDKVGILTPAKSLVEFGIEKSQEFSGFGLSEEEQYNASVNSGFGANKFGKGRMSLATAKQKLEEQQKETEEDTDDDTITDNRESSSTETESADSKEDKKDTKTDDEKKYSAPNGLRYYKNDIDYLTKNGYSEDTALEVLSKSEKYTKKVTEKEIEDSKKDAEKNKESNSVKQVQTSSTSSTTTSNTGNMFVDKLMGKVNQFLSNNPRFTQFMTFLFGTNPFANLFGSSGGGGSSGGAGASSSATGSVPPSEYAAKILQEARSHIGKPYSMAAGTGPNSYDCSGHAQTSYKAAGLDIPRTADYQYKFFKEKNAVVNIEQSQPGDLIFFENTYPTDTVDGNGITHVGVVSKSGNASSLEMVHASSSKGVIECGMSTWHQQHLPSGRPCIGSLSLAFGGAAKKEDTSTTQTPTQGNGKYGRSKYKDELTNPDKYIPEIHARRAEPWTVDENKLLRNTDGFVNSTYGKGFDPNYFINQGYTIDEAFEKASKMKHQQKSNKTVSDSLSKPDLDKFLGIKDKAEEAAKNIQTNSIKQAQIDKTNADIKEEDIKEKDEKLSKYLAPNGEKYTQNDIQYLLNNNYSLKDAIDLLSKDPKYTKKSDKDKKSTSDSINAIIENKPKKKKKTYAELIQTSKMYNNGITNFGLESAKYDPNVVIPTEYIFNAEEDSDEVAYAKGCAQRAIRNGEDPEKAYDEAIEFIKGLDKEEDKTSTYGKGFDPRYFINQGYNIDEAFEKASKMKHQKPKKKLSKSDLEKFLSVKDKAEEAAKNRQTNSIKQTQEDAKEKDKTKIKEEDTKKKDIKIDKTIKDSADVLSKDTTTKSDKDKKSVSDSINAAVEEKKSLSDKSLDKPKKKKKTYAELIQTSKMYNNGLTNFGLESAKYDPNVVIPQEYIFNAENDSDEVAYAKGCAQRAIRNGEDPKKAYDEAIKFMKGLDKEEDKTGDKETTEKVKKTDNIIGFSQSIIDNALKDADKIFDIAEQVTHKKKSTKDSEKKEKKTSKKINSIKQAQEDIKDTKDEKSDKDIPTAPNGEKYTKNDIQYLLDNGYSLKDAIELLSKDPKYTTKKSDKDKKSASDSINEATKKNKEKDNEEDVLLASDGEEYSINDIQYLVDSGYSLEDAIDILSKDPKYTEKDKKKDKEEDKKKTTDKKEDKKKSVSDSINEIIKKTKKDIKKKTDDKKEDKKDKKKISKKTNSIKQAQKDSNVKQKDDIILTPDGEEYSIDDIQYLLDNEYTLREAINFLSEEPKFDTDTDEDKKSTSDSTTKTKKNRKDIKKDKKSASDSINEATKKNKEDKKTDNKNTGIDSSSQKIIDDALKDIDKIFEPKDDKKKSVSDSINAAVEAKSKTEEAIEKDKDDKPKKKKTYAELIQTSKMYNNGITNFGLESAKYDPNVVIPKEYIFNEREDSDEIAYAKGCAQRAIRNGEDPEKAYDEAIKFMKGLDKEEDKAEDKDKKTKDKKSSISSFSQEIIDNTFKDADKIFDIAEQVTRKNRKNTTLYTTKDKDKEDKKNPIQDIFEDSIKDADNIFDIAEQVTNTKKENKIDSKNIPTAPNGKKYTQNDIQYLLNNGYSLKDAIDLLSKDPKYTDKSDKDKKSASDSINAAVEGKTKDSEPKKKKTYKEIIQTSKIYNNGITDFGLESAEYDPDIEIPEEYIFNENEDSDEVAYAKGCAQRAIRNGKDPKEAYDEAIKFIKSIDKEEDKTEDKDKKSNISDFSQEIIDNAFKDADKIFEIAEQTTRRNKDIANGKKNTSVIKDDEITTTNISDAITESDGTNTPNAIHVDSTKPTNKKINETIGKDSIANNTGNFDSLVEAQNKTNELLTAILAVIKVAAENVGNSNSADNDNKALVGPIKSILSTLGGGSGFGIGDKFLGNLGNRDNTKGDIGYIMTAMDTIARR